MLRLASCSSFVQSLSRLRSDASVSSRSLLGAILFSGEYAASVWVFAHAKGKAMIELLQLYVSGFWVWVGLTLGLGMVLGIGLKWSVLFVIGVIAAIRGSDLNIS